MPFHAKKAYLAEKAPQIAWNICTVDKWAIQWLFLSTAINKASRLGATDGKSPAKRDLML